MSRLEKIINEVLLEEKEKRDRCLRIADRKFDKPSAYKSGAVVRCRQGKIWKDIKEGKQVGLLYHFTRTGELIGILQSNILKASDQWATDDDPRPFNSFTRNKNGCLISIKFNLSIWIVGLMTWKKEFIKISLI